MTQIVLHGYWRSGTSYRTRIALNLKGLDYRQEPVNLLQQDHRGDAYRALNPSGLVPTLVAGELVLTQSSAIIEWLEERFPDPPILPKDADQRAIVRAMAMVIACDTHPLNNLRVLNALRDDLGGDNGQRGDWIARWICDAFAALEVMIGRHCGIYAFGDTPTIADCHIVPQAYAAERFNVPLDKYPKLARIVANARTHPAFAKAHPERQSDAG